MALRFEDWTGEPCVDRLYAGELTGVVIRGAIEPASIRSVLEKLPGRLPRFELAPQPAPLHALGLMLVPTARDPRGPDLHEYFETAAHTEPLWDELVGPVLAALHQGFRALSGRPVDCLAGLRGRYAPCSVRVLPEGYFFPAHCDTYPPLPAFAELHALTDRSTQLSWYVPLQVPGSGGGLRVWPVGPDGARDPLPHPREATDVTLQAGDLVLFDGARHVHEVLPVEKGPARITLGGFAAFSPDREQLLYWS